MKKSLSELLEQSIEEYLQKVAEELPSVPCINSK